MGGIKPIHQGFISPYISNPRSFSLPAHHTYWDKSGSGPPPKDSKRSSSAAAPSTTAERSSKAVGSKLAPLIARYKTGSDDSQFTSFLADMERALNKLGIVSKAVVAIPFSWSTQSPIHILQFLSAIRLHTTFGSPVVLCGIHLNGAYAVIAPTTNAPANSYVGH